MLDNRHLCATETPANLHTGRHHRPRTHFRALRLRIPVPERAASPHSRAGRRNTNMGTLLGPLTTAWEPPSGCTAFVPQCSTCGVGWFGQTCVTDSGDTTAHAEDDPECWPPRSEGVRDHTWPLQGWGYYSPGLECPVGYSTACYATYGGSSDWDIQFALRPSETAVGCCPTYVSLRELPVTGLGLTTNYRGFDCTWANGQTCVATGSTATIVQATVCEDPDQTAPTRKTFPDIVNITSTDSDGSTVTAQVTRTINLYAPLFQLNYQPTDLITTTTGSTSGTTTGSQSTSTGESGGSGGLSTGAAAGIGVGGGIAALAIVFAAFMVGKKRRARRREEQIAELAAGTPTFAPVYPSPPPQGHTEYKPPGSPQYYSELPGHNPAVELPAQGHMSPQMEMQPQSPPQTQFQTEQR